MVTTNDKDLVSKMKSSREFGKEKKGIFTNYHVRFGYNWRMPEVAALLGIRQLQSIGGFIEKRTKIAGIYDAMLQGLNGVRIINPPEKSRFNYFKYILILEKFDREKTHEALENNGINLSGYVYELPLHKQPVFPVHNKIDLPNTEFLCRNHICLPIYPALKIEDAKYIAEILLKIF